MARYEVKRASVFGGKTVEAGSVISLDPADAIEFLGSGRIVPATPKNRAVQGDGETKPKAKRKATAKKRAKK